MKKFGFTLAEVLITLGIIGVVSALTMPNLIANYQKKVWVTQLKKDVNFLANNIKLLFANESVDNLCDTDIAECPSNWSENVFIYGDKYGQYFKLSEAPSNSLFTQTAKELQGEHEWLKTFNLNDGSCIATASSYGGSWIASLGFFIDINCDKNPNKWGRDRFLIQYDSKGILYNINDTEEKEMLSEMCNNYNDVYSDDNFFLGMCAYKIMEDGWKMNY